MIPQDALRDWLRRESSQRFRFFSVAETGLLLALLATMVLAIQLSLSSSKSVFPWVFGPVTIYSLLICIEWTRHSRTKHRQRPNLGTYIWQLPPGGLSAVIPNVDRLAAAARDLSHLSARLPLLPREIRKPVLAAADGRMRRAFELAVGRGEHYLIPADETEAIIEEDVRWLAEARRLAENDARPRPTGEPDPLAQLRELADARAELRL